MKITFLTPHIRIAGGVKNILIFANLLVERGHTVNVVTEPPGNLSRSKIKTILRYITRPGNLNWSKLKTNLHRVIQNSENGLDWMKLEANLLYVPDFCEKMMPDADIIVCTGGSDGPIVNNYGPQKGEKFVFFQHFGAHGLTEEEKAVAQMPFKKLVLASWIGQLLQERFGQNSTLVRCPVDTNFFYPVNRQDHTCKVVGMLHHTAKWKGIADGLKAFELAKQKCPEINLVMFGCHGTPPISQLPYCTFYYDPPQKELRSIYSSCDIWVCPSWTEGFGMTSVEAMACRCALVTTDNGGSRDYAFPEETALVSPPQQPELLAQNIIRLINEDTLQEQIATNGYKLVQTFTWKAATDIMENAFREALYHKI